jgi:hypothetical protein
VYPKSIMYLLGYIKALVTGSVSRVVPKAAARHDGVP